MTTTFRRGVNIQAASTAELKRELQYELMCLADDLKTCGQGYPSPLYESTEAITTELAARKLGGYPSTYPSMTPEEQDRGLARLMQAVLAEQAEPKPIRQLIVDIMGMLKSAGAIGGLALDMLAHVLHEVDQLAADLRDSKVKDPAAARRRLTGHEHDPDPSESCRFTLGSGERCWLAKSDTKHQPYGFPAHDWVGP